MSAVCMLFRMRLMRQSLYVISRPVVVGSP